MFSRLNLAHIACRAAPEHSREDRESEFVTLSRVITVSAAQSSVEFIALKLHCLVL